MKDLDLEVETLEDPLHMSSPVRTRVSVDQICRDCELEISACKPIFLFNGVYSKLIHSSSLTGPGRSFDHII